MLKTQGESMRTCGHRLMPAPTGRTGLEHEREIAGHNVRGSRETNRTGTNDDNRHRLVTHCVTPRF